MIVIMMSEDDDHDDAYFSIFEQISIFQFSEGLFFQQKKFSDFAETANVNFSVFGSFWRDVFNGRKYEFKFEI